VRPCPRATIQWSTTHSPQRENDGWRAIDEIAAGLVHVWSRNGNDWIERLPELKVLSELDAVLDGELVVATPDGRVDFHLLSARLSSRRLDPAVPLYVFDLLSLNGSELLDQPWRARRAVLEGLGLAERTSGLVRPTLWSEDCAAMHAATAAIGAEGTTSKRVDSPSRPGRSRLRLKAKHKLVAEL
jgi:bifunctional non-homologous end joining protein LigD